MKGTIIIIAMLLILATAILVIIFNFHDSEDLTGSKCNCPIPECPHVVKQAPQDGAQAEMYVIPYERIEK